ncbi:hypothetical protein L596_020647 [Steinernema carpocapsae]|uniref:Uncharacterized protein n=1 Tax=Steinernema carpocapsae TaxID=34508 RepID=A0A4U5MU60_STECR|nr:hypothetical protein L596_020647 [Steinernema carpocapsae]
MPEISDRMWVSKSPDEFKRKLENTKGRRSDLLDRQQGHPKSRSSVFVMAQKNYASYFDGMDTLVLPGMYVSEHRSVRPTIWPAVNSAKIDFP